MATKKINTYDIPARDSLYCAKTGLDHVVIECYKIGEDFEPIAFCFDKVFYRRSELERFFRKEHAKQVNRTMWAGPWYQADDPYTHKTTSYRMVYKAPADFKYAGHMTAFGVSDADKADFIAHGWEV